MSLLDVSARGSSSPSEIKEMIAELLDKVKRCEIEREKHDVILQESHKAVGEKRKEKAQLLLVKASLEDGIKSQQVDLAALRTEMEGLEAARETVQKQLTEARIKAITQSPGAW